MTTKVNNGVIDVLLDRSWDMGLSFIDQGKFESREELTKLLDLVYPWVLDAEDKQELTQQILENGYIEPDFEDIDCLQIEGSHLYAHYQDIDVMNICDCLIYDKSKKNFLIGFSAFGWLYIDGAIDLATGTIGYYNDNEDVYTPVGNLRDEDVEMLSEVIQDKDWSIDYKCTVKRENKVAA